MVSDMEAGARLKIGRSILFFAILLITFVVWVDLKPKISSDFFFGSEDPAALQSRKISTLFPSQEFLILSVHGGNIYSKSYFRAIEVFSAKLGLLPGVTRLISLSDGPGSTEDARNSPFWKPLLINEAETATSLILFVSSEAEGPLVGRVEEIRDRFENKDGLSTINISGMPYIAEQIRRSLVQDAKIFSTLALALFVLLIAAFYRSAFIALGSCISGLSSIFLTLILSQLLGQSIGILTANLAIIAYILVQSQIIYLTNNWLGLKSSLSKQQAVSQAVRKTMLPSLWCGATTLLGFISLLFVSAEPLRQLGASGAIAVIAAFLCCYGLYPSFLLISQAKQRERRVAARTGSYSVLQYLGVAALGVGVFLTAPGLLKLQTDPSLFSYFEPQSEIRAGLEVIDRNGGSSPLQLVVSLKSGAGLDSEEAYKKLWALHRDLAENDQVATVLSLPALLAEANAHPLAFLIPWREMVTLLSLDLNQGVVQNFLTKDRKQALFLLRMKEEGRSQSRLDVMRSIEEKIENQGFRLDLSGGVYFLQGQLASLVRNSLLTGLATLLLLFFGIAWIATRHIPLSIAMLISAMIIPLLSLGGIGLLDVPLDVISAPAISVGLGLAVDALIHLGLAIRRSAQTGGLKFAWQQALAEQSNGILVSSGVIALGFLIFSLSGFPPTVRFGMIIAICALLAIIVGLAMLPVAGRLLDRRQ